INLSGRVDVQYVDYRIHIYLRGTPEEPQIDLESDPHLPEDQIISVLLFGRTLEELGSDQTESVGSTRAALTDGAVGLASMYLLASTPVESVGYNPLTKTFTAKVRLADGTSLNLGTDMKDLTQVGIRKRLSREWSIGTYLENPL